MRISYALQILWAKHFEVQKLYLQNILQSVSKFTVVTSFKCELITLIKAGNLVVKDTFVIAYFLELFPLKK